MHTEIFHRGAVTVSLRGIDVWIEHGYRFDRIQIIHSSEEEAGNTYVRLFMNGPEDLLDFYERTCKFH